MIKFELVQKLCDLDTTLRLNIHKSPRIPSQTTATVEHQILNQVMKKGSYSKATLIRFPPKMFHLDSFRVSNTINFPIATL